MFTYRQAQFENSIFPNITKFNLFPLNITFYSCVLVFFLINAIVDVNIAPK